MYGMALSLCAAWQRQDGMAIYIATVHETRHEMVMPGQFVLTQANQ